MAPKLHFSTKLGLENAPSVDASLDLEELRQILYDELDHPVDDVRAPSDFGTKDGGLTVALTIAGLSISAASVFLRRSHTGDRQNQSIPLHFM